MYDPTFELTRIDAAQDATDALSGIENETMVALPLWMVQSLANFVSDLPHALPLAVTDRAQDAYGRQHAANLLMEYLSPYKEADHGVFEF